MHIRSQNGNHKVEESSLGKGSAWKDSEERWDSLKESPISPKPKEIYSRLNKDPSIGILLCSLSVAAVHAWVGQLHRPKHSVESGMEENGD